MALRAFHVDGAGSLRSNLNTEEIKAVLGSQEGLLWVDVERTDEEDIEALADIFDFHPLPLQDCLSETIRPPKVENFGDYLFMVLHGIDYTSIAETVETTELDMFLGEGYVVSSHSVPILAVSALRTRIEQDVHLLGRGAEFLAYTIIDALVANIIPTIDKMGEVTDDVEVDALNQPEQSTLETILKLRRSSRRIHRVMTPQREVLSRLSAREFESVDPSSEVYFRHAYDRVVQVQDLNDAIGDRAESAMSIYLSAVGIRQNETMKSLAIVASIFLPLSLVAGIYGMNFENMPELEVPWGYYAILTGMALAVAGTMWWFWARNWITWGRRQVSKARVFAVAPEKLIDPLVGLVKRPRL